MSGHSDGGGHVSSARDSGLLSGYDTCTTARSSRGSSSSSTDSLTSWSSKETQSQHSYHPPDPGPGHGRHSITGLWFVMVSKLTLVSNDRWRF